MEHKEFPKVKYPLAYPHELSVVVYDKTEEQALTGEWFDTPSARDKYAFEKVNITKLAINELEEEKKTLKKLSKKESS